MLSVDLIMNVFTCVLSVGFLWFFISFVCCGESSPEDAERTAALAEYELALRSLAETRPPVEVELVRPVVPAAVAKKLGYFLYSVERRNASEYLECAICLGVLESGEECSEVPACQHLFHRDCIAVWMDTKTSCPLCRRTIVTGSEPAVSAADDMV